MAVFGVGVDGCDWGGCGWMCLGCMWKDIFGLGVEVWDGCGGMYLRWVWRGVYGMYLEVGVNGCVLGGCGGMYFGWVGIDVFWVDVDRCFWCGY